MVHSPRKRAPRAAFDQTWDETDAASLDPSSLPVARIRRGWERKQEVKKTEEGKDKTIWRRFNLRSRAANTTEETDEQEHDVRSRAVKKQQHMSPEAMEKISAKPNGKKRAFKATRWDRRKSVLPRKRSTRLEAATMDPLETADADPENRGAADETSSDESSAELPTVHETSVDTESGLVPDGQERRATFTFTMEADTVEDLPNYESFDELQNDDNQNEGDEAQSPIEDATIARLFRSPSKEQSLLFRTSPTEVEYPELPHDEEEQLQPGTIFGQRSVDQASDSEQADDVMVAEEDTVPVEDLEGVTMDAEKLPTDAELDNLATIEFAAQTSRHRETSTLEHTKTEVSASPAAASLSFAYPALPSDEASVESYERSKQTSPQHDVEITEKDLDVSNPPIDTHTDRAQEDFNGAAEDATSPEPEPEIEEEDFTEASLQLDIQKDYEEALDENLSARSEVSGEKTEADAERLADIGHTAAQVDTNRQSPKITAQVEQPAISSSISQPVETHTDDITDGLTLSFTPAKLRSIKPTPRKLHSPPPPSNTAGLDDVTMTIALDDDTALLKDFLNRAAASKAEKQAVLTHRRESLQNRRDSDVIRHALASPRKVLEDKDPNSPSKYDNELTLDLSQTLTLSLDKETTPDEADAEDAAEGKSGRTSRRSSRTKKSRLPAPASASATPLQPQTSKIAIRRVDGTEHVVLKKSDAQELATLTRANTRKNKQGAFNVTVRLLKLAVDGVHLPPVDDADKELIVGKNIRWDETLAYYQENPETLADAASLATPDELSMPDAMSTTVAKPKAKISRTSTPKIRRVRGLGSANGTPGKGLLAPAELLPEGVLDESNASGQQLPRLKAGKSRKMSVASTSTDIAPISIPTDTKLPSLDVMPVGVEPTKERKSRLAAPKKVVLPQVVVPAPAEGKENAQRTGISASTPKKGIPAPKVIIPPSVGMESGLPRRRGRKY